MPRDLRNSPLARIYKTKCNWKVHSDYNRICWFLSRFSNRREITTHLVRYIFCTRSHRRARAFSVAITETKLQQCASASCISFWNTTMARLSLILYCAIFPKFRKFYRGAAVLNKSWRIEKTKGHHFVFALCMTQKSPWAIRNLSATW